MLQVYSDAGVLGGKAFASALVLRDEDTFCTLFHHVYYHVHSAVVGEILALAQGLEWAISSGYVNEPITIYVDNASVVCILQRYIQGEKSIHGTNAALWVHLYRLCDQLKIIEISHVRAHQSRQNPNKVCDRLSTAHLKYYSSGGARCTL